MAEVSGCGGGRGECEERERVGGSYHRPVFGEEKVLSIDLAAVGLSDEGLGYVLLV